MLWILLVGVVTGMRTMTIMAVLCCYAYFGAYPALDHSWAFWVTKLVSAIIFTCAALGEYFADVQPQTPNRTAPALAISRLVFGALGGAIASAISIQPAAGGAILGAIGALLGTWGGYHARMRLARAFGRDLPAGLCESAFALCLAIFLGYCLHNDGVTALSYLNR